MVRVKICGITSTADAKEAERAGADAVGFVFAKGPRRISPTKAKSIIRKLGPWIAKVGVFVNESPRWVLHAAKTCGLDAVQLHGDETQADIRSLRAKGLVVIKALRVKTASDLVRARSIEADAILLDTAVPGIQGGTGKRFDWTLLKYFKTKIPVIVSGGLSKKNIQELLGQYTPYGVDVSSGVERSPGIKDVKKIREFVRRARSSPK